MMNSRRLPPGLYWIVRDSPKKGFEHHAILDVGNRMRCADAVPWQDMIIHQTPPSIRREPVVGTDNWRVLQRIVDEPNAIRRLIAATANPTYNTFGNNCEHFARYIATGVRESHQLQHVGVMALAVGLLWAAVA